MRIIYKLRKETLKKKCYPECYLAKMPKNYDDLEEQVHMLFTAQSYPVLMEQGLPGPRCILNWIQAGERSTLNPIQVSSSRGFSFQFKGIQSKGIFGPMSYAVPQANQWGYSDL